METTILGRIERLRQMNVGALRDEWLRLYGEPSRSRNHDYLWKRLAWRVQELAHGGLSEHATARIDALATDTFTRARTPTAAVPAVHGATDDTRSKPVRDPRLPAIGTVITKTYHGRELRLVVRDDHFELDGQSYGSLSEAARHVTGSRWNGPLFWGLTKRKRS